MALFTLTINDPGFDKKSAEMAYIERTVALAMVEASRARGQITSGVITAQHPGFTGVQSLGSWTYTPSASKP